MWSVVSVFLWSFSCIFLRHVCCETDYIFTEEPASGTQRLLALQDVMHIHAILNNLRNWGLKFWWTKKLEIRKTKFAPGEPFYKVFPVLSKCKNYLWFLIILRMIWCLDWKPDAVTMMTPQSIKAPKSTKIMKMLDVQVGVLSIIAFSKAEVVVIMQQGVELSIRKTFISNFVNQLH